ncbi:MAG: glutamine-hydrolyzing carbamoyl-phosphate synthase small subunit [Methanomicrobiales archaeon]|nr:glutamine-hydrolyzing carbamoyl-phosphate synthase small subunit [Methanomicrobiales archaeon]
MKAVLGLENGDFVVGEGFGVEGMLAGELVFTTQMTGYMEALTDPSYHGQILMFTFPLIGIYGVDRQNFQSKRIWARGCVVQEVCTSRIHHPSLEEFFGDESLLGISGVDTRRLTIAIREQGTVRAALIVGSDDHEAAVSCARRAPPISERDLIPEVSTRERIHIAGRGKRFAVIDLGIKRHMIESLKERGADIHIFPHDASHDEVASIEPEVLFVSNGPGDPRRAKHAIACVEHFIGELPIFGVCMGNQIAALALGAETRKMKFGHRGTNQPVRYIDGHIFITTQNHGFVVDHETLPEGCRITYSNVNDGTLEGFEERDLNISCVQFHPEAHGGPRDTDIHYFDEIFRRLP